MRQVALFGLVFPKPKPNPNPNPTPNSKPKPNQACKKGKTPAWPEGKVRKNEIFKPKTKKDKETEDLMARRGLTLTLTLTLSSPNPNLTLTLTRRASGVCRGWKGRG